jgi:hypothetical protein
MRGLSARLRALVEAEDKGPWPKDVLRVGEPRKETRPAPRGRGLADSWRIGQLFRVGDERHQIVTSWKGIPWTEAEQKALLASMRMELAQQKRTGSSRLVLEGAGRWVLP